MNRKSAWIIFSSFFLLHLAQAQVGFGIRAGANFSNWRGESLQVVQGLVEKSDGYIVTKGITGFHVGGYVSIPISQCVLFEPGLLYSKKGYALKGDMKMDALKFLALNAGVQVIQHYIDLPLVIKANIYKGLQIYAGPQVSYLARSTLNAKLGVLGISIFNKGYGITSRFNRIDLGVTGGLGYQFNNGLNILAGYDYGLSRLDKGGNYDVRNSVVKLSLGLRF